MVADSLAAGSLEILSKIGYVALWLQALGIILILWIVAEAFAFYYNRRRLKEVYAIRDDMKRIEGKIDRILGRKK